MESLLLKTGARYIAPVQLVFSIFLLLRGHNEPGGGFIGGLVAASGIALYAIASDVATARTKLRVSPHLLIGSGLLLAVCAGISGMGVGDPFLTAVWDGAMPMPAVGKVALGTPLLFDIGVYLVVLGVITLIIFSLIEST